MIQMTDIFQATDEVVPDFDLADLRVRSVVRPRFSRRVFHELAAENPVLLPRPPIRWRLHYHVMARNRLRSGWPGTRGAGESNSPPS